MLSVPMLRSLTSCRKLLTHALSAAQPVITIIARCKVQFKHFPLLACSCSDSTSASSRRATADGQGGRAVLAACAARRWLARNAEGVKLIRSYSDTEATVYGEASACASLVSCLPALEDVTFSPNAPLVRDNLGCLLEALAWCPRLTALDLGMEENQRNAADEDLYWPFPDAAVFAKLRGLTKLALFANEDDPFDLADVVAALMPLTGLVELDLGSLQHAIVPAALRQLKELRSLTLRGFFYLDLEAGCLDLPYLESLEFEGCIFEEDTQVLPGITALQRLTCFKLSGAEGPRFFDPQLAQLPRLQRLVLSQDTPVHSDFASGDMASCDPPGLLRLPADMGALKTSLLSVESRGSCSHASPSL